MSGLRTGLVALAVPGRSPPLATVLIVAASTPAPPCALAVTPRCRISGARRIAGSHYRRRPAPDHSQPVLYPCGIVSLVLLVVAGLRPCLFLGWLSVGHVVLGVFAGFVLAGVVGSPYWAQGPGGGTTFWPSAPLSAAHNRQRSPHSTRTQAARPLGRCGTAPPPVGARGGWVPYSSAGTTYRAVRPKSAVGRAEVPA